MKLLLDVYKGAAKDLRDKVEVKNQDLFDFFFFEERLRKPARRSVLKKKNCVREVSRTTWPYLFWKVWETRLKTHEDA